MFPSHEEARGSSGSARSKPAAPKARALLLILCGAVLLRVAVAIVFPNVHHPDETFQYVEPGHRVVFGYGIVPWEYILGARSWILPSIPLAVLEVSAHLGLGPDFYLPAIAAVWALLSLSLVYVAYSWGLRISSAHAVIAAVVAATWFELVYFAPKSLAEVVATDFAVVGLYLADAGIGPKKRRNLLIVGALLGFSVVLRPQLSPAVGAVLLFIARRDWRDKWLPLIAGAALPVLLLGAVDWLTWGAPFHSVLTYYRANATLARGKTIGQGSYAYSVMYGVKPFYQYVGHLMRNWSGAIVPIVCLAAYGARRRPLLAIMAVMVLLSHSFIPHKEYRFIYPAVACIILLAALGTGDVVARIGATSESSKGNKLTCFAIGAWVFTSCVLASGDGYRFRWRQDSAHLRAMKAVSRWPELCGLAVDNWQSTGGYSRLHRNVPLYDVAQPSDRPSAAAFNAIIASSLKPPPVSWGFASSKCFDGETVYNYTDPGACIFTRPGGCTADQPNELNELFRKAYAGM